MLSMNLAVERFGLAKPARLMMLDRVLKGLLNCQMPLASARPLRIFQIRDGPGIEKSIPAESFHIKTGLTRHFDG
jgi:hypothetical protein